MAQSSKSASTEAPLTLKLCFDSAKTEERDGYYVCVGCHEAELEILVIGKQKEKIPLSAIKEIDCPSATEIAAALNERY